MNPVTFAISPCPNDTFLFSAWMNKKISASHNLSLKMTDIEELNEWALSKKFPFIKASLSLLPTLSKNYFLLPVGAALGYGCGPKIISNKHFNKKDLHDKKILIPGKHTTAHALLNSLFPECVHKIFCSYETIFQKLINNEADCGVIIHESRFTFHSHGFNEITDLGEEWSQKTGLPIPLGGFFADRSLDRELITSVVQNLRLSLEYSKTNPDEAYPFMLLWSQEKDQNIIKKHVDLYVTKETYSLSSSGIRAIEKLTSSLLKDVLYV